MTKVAMIGQKGLPAQFGGVERHVEELSKRLASRGIEVTVYNRRWFSNLADGKFGKINIVTTPSIHTKHFDAISHTLFSTIHAIKNKFDVIHYHGVGPALLAWIPRVFAPQIHVVATFHCVDRKHAKWGVLARLALRIGEWAACKFPHSTIAVSRQILLYSREAFDANCKYIPNGVPVAKKVYDDSEIKEKFGVTAGNYFLAVTRLIPHKGVHYLITAFKKLDTNKKLVIVGGGHFTETYVKQLKKLAGEDKRIIFTGVATGNTLNALYTNAFAVVQPSVAEGLSIALLEAMSYGKPIISSDIPENTDPLGDAAIIFKSKNINELKNALEKVINMTDAQRNALGATAEKRVCELFDWEKIADSTVEVYKSWVKPVDKQVISAEKIKEIIRLA